MADHIDRFREARTACGLRQEDLAEQMRRAGFSWQRVTVAEVERGGRRLSMDEFVALCRLFVTTPNEVLGFERYVPPGEVPGLVERRALARIRDLAADVIGGRSDA